MNMGIKKDTQQQVPESEYQKVQINILFTASWINLQTTKLLKQYNISPQQFNILRILKGMHPEPATVKLLTERMIDKMSNASRLVEKLKQKGLVEREASEEDRRRVDVYITPEGIDLIEKASQAIDSSTEQNMSILNQKEAAELNRLLDLIRS